MHRKETWIAESGEEKVELAAPVLSILVIVVVLERLGDRFFKMNCSIMQVKMVMVVVGFVFAFC